MLEMHHRRWFRPVALALSLMLVFGTTAYAEEGSLEEPRLDATFDEAYYATLDYYGRLTEGSIVKSYRTFGNGQITDYGAYDAVNNLTDGTEPSLADGAVTFDLGEAAPSTFYFEGKTAEPYGQLPWTVSISYKLNGLPTLAQDMAGKTGMAEITLDVVPNAAASDYAKHNFVLMATTAFNDDDILSLEAPGAQVQLLGNLRTVIFMALPGEEQHYTIRVGSEDFAFPGLVMMMMPATLGQMDQIADLRQAKEDIQDSYDKLNDSLDVILGSLDGMGGSLLEAANGLDDLDKARGVIEDNKDDIYNRIDNVIESMYYLDDSFDEMNGHLTSAGHMISDVNDTLSGLYGSIAALREDLKTCRAVLDALAGELERMEAASGGSLSDSFRLHLEELDESLDDLSADTASLQKLLGAVSSGELESITYNGMTSDEVRAKLAIAENLHAAYESSGSGEFAEFVVGALMGQGYTQAQAAEAAPILVYLYQNKDGVEAKLAAMDEGNAAIDDINKQSSQLKDLSAALGMSGDYEAASGVAGDVSDLCRKLGSAGLGGDLKKLTALLDAAEASGATGALSAAASDTADQVDSILGDVQALLAVLAKYEGEVQQSLKDGRTASGNMQDLMTDLRKLMKRAETTMQKSGPYLDSGTQKTLSGLADALRRAAVGLGETGNIRSAKDTITDLIDEKWDEHTGDIDNLLLADPGAAMESLTDSRNGTPESIQIVMRTQEIKVQEEEEAAAQTAKGDTGTFGSRVAAMFRDLWNGITGIFRKK